MSCVTTSRIADVDVRVNGRRKTALEPVDPSRRETSVHGTIGFHGCQHVWPLRLADAPTAPARRVGTGYVPASSSGLDRQGSNEAST